MEYNGLEYCKKGITLKGLNTNQQRISKISQNKKYVLKILTGQQKGKALQFIQGSWFPGSVEAIASNYLDKLENFKEEEWFSSKLMNKDFQISEEENQGFHNSTPEE